LRTPGDQLLSILAKVEKKDTKLVDGDHLVNVGTDTQNSFEEGNLQLENLKKVLISIREEVERCSSLIDLGLVMDEVVLTAGLMQGPKTMKWLCWKRKRITNWVT
jgi:hypothetical protein